MREATTRGVLEAWVATRCVMMVGVEMIACTRTFNGRSTCACKLALVSAPHADLQMMTWRNGLVYFDLMGGGLVK